VKIVKMPPTGQVEKWKNGRAWQGIGIEGPAKWL